MGKKILAINPGSTSTKIAVYNDKKLLFKKNIVHSAEEMANFEKITDQYRMRYEQIDSTLRENKVRLSDLSAIVGRGGPMAPVKAGAYRVNEIMVNKLKNNPMTEHASNLGGIIAYYMAESVNIPAYIYDAVSTDQLTDIARISGIKEISRKSLVHALNMRAVAIKTAENMGKDYNEINLLVAHLGGGMTISIHEKGRMVDLISDDEGPFSPERAGRIPCRDLVNMCYKSDQKIMSKNWRGLGGLVSYLGTNSTIEVEKKIESGDEYAKLIYEAMAYQVSKGICELGAVVRGDVDRIIITGGIAYSKMITSWIKERVEWVAPVDIIPGENELEALAYGALRVINAEENAHEFKLD